MALAEGTQPCLVPLVPLDRRRGLAAHGARGDLHPPLGERVHLLLGRQSLPRRKHEKPHAPTAVGLIAAVAVRLKLEIDTGTLHLETVPAPTLPRAFALRRARLPVVASHHLPLWPRVHEDQRHAGHGEEAVGVFEELLLGQPGRHARALAKGPIQVQDPARVHPGLLGWPALEEAVDPHFGVADGEVLHLIPHLSTGAVLRKCLRQQLHLLRRATVSEDKGHAAGAPEAFVEPAEQLVEVTEGRIEQLVDVCVAVLAPRGGVLLLREEDAAHALEQLGDGSP
mmetsp:Transcript_93053/g.300879  ORF Transcript_93053/g.300879 Transcript_93053/m.300879 type:complete len:283 (+) Transcript_93053:346-1194(+)